MAEPLFPNVHTGFNYVKNYVLRKPYGPEKPFVTSKTGLDGAQGTRTSLTAEAIRQWDVPALDSKRDAVRLNLHEHAMQKIIRNQPPIQIKSLTEHVLKSGAWGLGEKGASWLAGEFSKDSRAREALLDAYTSPEMSSFVTEGSKPGIIRNRAWTNSALVIHGKPIEAGKHLYGALKNSTLYRGRMDELLARARQMDAEAARPAEPAPAPQAPQYPGELPEPENGRSYTIRELDALGVLRGAGQPVININNSPVNNNNTGTGNSIGGHPWPSQQEGYRQYDGQIVHDVPTYVEVENAAKKKVKPQKGGAKAEVANKVDRYRRFSVFKRKLIQARSSLLAGLPPLDEVEAQTAAAKKGSVYLKMLLARNSQFTPGALAKQYVPSQGTQSKRKMIAPGPQAATFQVRTNPSRLNSGEAPLALPLGAYSEAVRKLFKAHKFSEDSYGMHEENIYNIARSSKDHKEFKSGLLKYLQDFGEQKLKNKGGIREVFEAAKK